MDETYEEDEVFFGPISQKEGEKIAKIGNRKTRYLGQAIITNENENDVGNKVSTAVTTINLNLKADLNQEEFREEIKSNLNQEEFEEEIKGNFNQEEVREEITKADHNQEEFGEEIKSNLNQEEFGEEITKGNFNQEEVREEITKADHNQEEFGEEIKSNLNQEEFGEEITKGNFNQEEVREEITKADHNQEEFGEEIKSNLNQEEFGEEITKENFNQEEVREEITKADHNQEEFGEEIKSNLNQEEFGEEITKGNFNQEEFGEEIIKANLGQEEVREEIIKADHNQEEFGEEIIKADLNHEEVREEITKDFQIEENTNSNYLESYNSEQKEIVNINEEDMNDDSMYDTYNSSVCGLEYDNSDLNEENISNENSLQNYSDGCENVNKAEGTAEVISENEEILQEEIDQISNITFQMKEALSIEKNLESNVNNLNKCDINTLKRESYFTSLKLINVHDDTFATDFLNESVNSDGATGKVLYENKEQVHVLSNSLTSEVKACSLEVNSSEDNANNGLLLSRSLSSESFNQRTVNKYENFCKDSENHIKEINTNGEDKHIYIPDLTNSPDSHLSYSSSSEQEHRFNDTIEEMELLLARGIDYYKDEGVEDDSIVENAKEQTISSSNSITSFNPNFDSTHASSGDISKTKVPEIRDEQCYNPSVEKIPFLQPSELKKIPPEKPPRIIISASPQPHSRQLPIDLYKQESSGEVSSNSNFFSSPIVKTVTKSKFENYADNRSVAAPRSCQRNKPYFSKRISPTMTPRSTYDNQYCLSTPKSSKQLVKKSTLNTPASCNKLSASKSKIPRLTPPKPNPVFLTPQNILPSRIRPTISKSAQPVTRHRKLNIVSPVMKYLQDNPPPPFITTVKPRYKLSPSSSVGRTAGDKMDSDSVKTDQVIQKAKMISFKSPLKEPNMSLDKSPSENGSYVTSVLPSSVYMKGDSVQLNKENLCSKRIVPSDRPPIYILKHTGRTKVPKEAVISSPLEKFDFEASGQNGTPGRTSLMEVSIYEQRSVRRGNTLK